MGLYDLLGGIRGILSQPEPQGLLGQPEQPTGLLGALTVNPLMARQVEAQRAANPRPDVTDLFGYGPTWQTYLQNMNQNLQGQLPQPTDSGEVMAKKGLGLLGNFAPFGITVFHGSPHKFDRFDMSKVGSGEGAQAYGHGLYFAENPKVASSYRQAGNQGSLESQGSLYKVDLPDEAVGKMLDWDKPLSQQPENVRNAIEKIKSSVDAGPWYWGPSIYSKTKGVEDSASYFYGLLKAKVGDEQASRMLREAGVTGISYLDQGSRAAGAGTRNFVVFDDSLPKILETSP